jgi:hypothetical protein
MIRFWIFDFGFSIRRLLIGNGVGFALCTILLTPNSSAEAQQTKKVPRVGVLLSGSRTPVWGEAFHQALRELGYLTGKTSILNTAMARAYPTANPRLRENWLT